MFGVLDVVLIILIILAILIGMWRGLIGSLAKLLGGFLKLVVSILLTKPVVKLLCLTKIDEQMFGKLELKYSGISEKFTVNLVGMSSEELNTFIADALSDAKIPKLFRGLFQNLFNITPETLAVKESVTIAELMGVAVGNIILLASTFVLLVVLLWIISKLLLKWSKRNAKKKTLFAKTNKWLGGLFGLIKIFICILIVNIVIASLANFSFMSSVTTYVNNSFLGGPLYRLSKSLLETSFDVKGLIESWITKN